MTNLSYDDLFNIEGGSNLGNALLTVGGTLISIGTGGAGGVVIGTAIAVFGLLSDWD